MEKKQGSINWLVEEINKQKAWADPSKLEPIIQQAKAMHDEEIKNAQMDMFNHLNDLPYGLTYFARIQDAEDFADNYKTFAGNNE